MRVERTEDIAFIRYIIHHPEIHEMLIEDGQSEIPVPIRQNLYYLVPKIEIGMDGIISDAPIGCILFAQVNSVTWNPHIGILPMYRGNGTEAMGLGVQWMFDNTPCRKIVANPPSYNKAMIRVFEKCNFNYEGRSPKSVLRNGLLHDRLMMGKEK